MQSYLNCGVVVWVILMTFYIFLSFLVAYLPLITLQEGQLTYEQGNLFTLFPAESMNLMYNSNNIDGSANTLFEPILNAYGGKLVSQPQTWSYDPTTQSNMTQFLVEVGDDISKENNIGAFYVSEETDGSFKYYAGVVYANVSSPSSFPAYGEILLTSIGKQVTGNNDF